MEGPPGRPVAGHGGWQSPSILGSAEQGTIRQNLGAVATLAQGTDTDAGSSCQEAQEKPEGKRDSLEQLPWPVGPEPTPGVRQWPGGCCLCHQPHSAVRD